MQASRGPRAVVLLGPPGSGKTTLARALLAHAGGGPLTAPEPWRLAHGAYGAGPDRVSLLDPPGDPELAGELHAALRVADAALLVLSPVQGVDPRTVALWESLAALPRLVVLSQLDRPGADADEAVAVCRRLLGDEVVPVQLPLHDDDGSVGGLLDLLDLTVSEAGARRPADDEHVTLVSGLRDELLEAVLPGSDDEALFEAWLRDEEPPPQVLHRELAAATGRGDVAPVLVAVPRRGVGLAELAALLGALPRAAPSPLDPAGAAPPVAEAVRPGLLRVWAGPLAPGDAVLVRGEPAAWPGPAAQDGEVLEADVDALPREVVAGRPVALAPWAAPPAAFPVGAPDDPGLAARVAGDPVARLEHDARTGQLLLWTYGPAHAEALLAGLPAAPVRVPPGSRPVPLGVEVPSWAERAVRSDVAARGGRVTGGAPADAGVRLDVELPPAEAVGYALSLARVSAGTGVLTRQDAPG